jgi:hypothetical protein
MRIHYCLLLAACANHPDLATSTEKLTQTSKVTQRGIDLTANTLDDWNRSTMLDPAIVGSGTLRARYCAEHFPAGSQALANLNTAIATYNAIPGVAINITDIAAEPGTTTHPDLATIVLPSNAIYFDFDDTFPSNVFAGMAHPNSTCDASSPKECTRARIYVNPDKVPAGDAPSVGVFMHEIGHAFGMQHINEDDDSLVLNNYATMSIDRTVIHGNKLHSDDFRSTVIHAGTLAFLRHYYPDASSEPDLETDEIVTHRNMSIADPDVPMHIELNPSKSYMGFGSGASLIADLNETKLRWNPSAENGAGGYGAFEPCTAPDTLPRWLARMSDTSTSTTNTPFTAIFQVSQLESGAPWTTVAEREFDSHNPNQTEFRQIDWEKTFPISASDLGVTGGAGITTMTRRKLRFEADSTGALAERNESNNAWWVNLCLYPSSDTTCQNASVVCDQP